MFLTNLEYASLLDFTNFIDRTSVFVDKITIKCKESIYATYMNAYCQFKVGYNILIILSAVE